MYISLGPNCLGAILLRHLYVRNNAYPFDWANGTSLNDIISIINNKDAFNITDWNFLKDIHNCLPHDRLNDPHGDDENLFENCNIIEKYERRFKRFFKDIYVPGVNLLRIYKPQFGSLTEELNNLSILQKMLTHANIIFIDGTNLDDEKIKNILKQKLGNCNINKTYKLVFDIQYISENELKEIIPCTIEKIILLLNNKNIETDKELIKLLCDFDPLKIVNCKNDIIEYVRDAYNKNNINIAWA
jgi:hypothetical protein